MAGAFRYVSFSHLPKNGIMYPGFISLYTEGATVFCKG